MHGRYTVLRKIADGGMAEIFLGLQSGAGGFQRPVVLKRLRAGLAEAPEHRGALANEARAAMGLGHSNIVQVLDLGTSGGGDYLVLELVRGWDLHRLLKRAEAAGEPLPLALGVYIACEVCRALAFAHSRAEEDRPCGIIHCDVNPHNILVSQEGEVKLTDFGIAVAADADQPAACALIKGKAGFMSPEQAAGKPLDPRSDLYSLGSTLFTMATGRRPFEGPSDAAVLELNKRGRAAPPAVLRSDLPPEIDAVIRKAMQRSPRKRYPSAEAMLAELEQILRRSGEAAGQTALKRWLAELASKDGERPVARGEPLDRAPGLGAEVQALEIQLAEEKGELRPAGPPPLPEDALAPATPGAEEPRLASRTARRGAAMMLALVVAGAAGVWRLGLVPWPGRSSSPARALEAPAASGEVSAWKAALESDFALGPGGPADLAPPPSL